MGFLRRRRKRREDGVSAVEFGLVLPLFIIILLGIMDYGWVYYVKLTMTNAAREGARVGVTLDTNIESGAQTAAKGYLGAAGFNPDEAQWSVSSNLADPTLSVTVSVNPFKPLVGFVPTPSQLSSTAAMRWELSTVTGSGS
jgi:Flp pilus assembly protein TadG